MSYLMASDVVAHLERNGDIAITGRGLIILGAFAALIALCAIAIIIAVGDVAKKAGR